MQLLLLIVSRYKVFDDVRKIIGDFVTSWQATEEIRFSLFFLLEASGTLFLSLSSLYQYQKIEECLKALLLACSSNCTTYDQKR